MALLSARRIRASRSQSGRSDTMILKGAKQLKMNIRISLRAESKSLTQVVTYHKLGKIVEKDLCPSLCKIRYGGRMGSSILNGLRWQGELKRSHLA